MEAKTEYAKGLELVQKELDKLKEKLKKHKKLQSSDEKNWGYIGDMGYVLEKVKEMNNFLNF